MSDLPRARLRFEFERGRPKKVVVQVNDVDVADLSMIASDMRLELPVTGVPMWHMQFLADLDDDGDPFRRTYL